SPLMAYDPTEPYGKDNPAAILYPDANPLWRPEAMVAGRDSCVYVGSVPSYGLLSGTLSVIDPTTRQVKHSYQVMSNQSIVSLACWNGCIVGGTSVSGGMSTSAVTKEAKIFLWDPQTQRKLYEMVPVPGADEITDLVT